MVLGMVDIRRQDGNTHVLTLSNITGNFSGRIQHRGHQRRHVLPGIMALQVRCLVRNHRIANRMGLVKGVVCKGDDFIIDGLAHRFRHAVGDATSNALLLVTIDEDLSLCLDDFHLFLGNGPANIIRLTHGITAQTAKNLNNLLLVDNTAVGYLQDRLQQGRLIGDLFPVQLIFDKGGDRIHGTGTVKGHDCRNIFNRTGLHVHTDTGHARRFQLENALGLTLPEHLESSIVIIRCRVHGKSGIDLLNLHFRVTNDRQVPQAQEIHLQQAQFLNGGHGVLGDDGIVISGQGHITTHRLRGDHNTGGVGGSVSGHTFQAHGGVDELFDPVIPIVHFLQLGGNLQRLFQGNVQCGGHQLCNNIRFRVGKIQRTTHVTDGTAGSHGTEGGDLGHMVSTVFAHNILNHFAAAFLTEVRIEIRHGNTFRVQEPLENQRILHGVHFRDVHAVGSNGSGTGASAGSNRDALFLGVTDEVPDDQVVIDVTHSGNNANFILQPVQIFFRRVFIPLLESVIADFPEVFLVGVALGHRKRGQMIFVEHEFQIAHIGNLHSILKSLVAVGEQLTELFFALNIKFLGLEFHAVGLVHGSAGLDAQQNILHFRILLPEVVGIVTDDQRQARFPCQAENALVDHPLFVDAVVLELQIEMLRSENSRHLQSIGLCRIIIFIHQVLGNTAGQTSRGGNEALMVFFQQFQVHTGLAIETMGKRFGHHQAQILITLPIFAEKHQMVRVIVNAVNTVFHPTAGNIDLAADDGLHTGGLGSFVEINTAVHDAVIGDGNCPLAQLLHPLHQAVNAADTIQKTVFGMDMKMYKTHAFASLASLANCTRRFRRLFMAGFVMGGTIISASSDKGETGCSSLAFAA